MKLTSTNQSQFAQIVDLSTSYISELLKGNKENLSVKSAKRISEHLGIDLQWLETGEGSAPEFIKIRTKDEADNSTINILTIASVGSTHDEENFEPIDQMQLPTVEVTVDGKILTQAVKAEGDSMYPTIVDKGLVGVDFDDKNIVNNAIYLIRFPDLGIAIKRLQLRTSGLLVESDNKQVVSEEVDKSILEQGFVVGRVRWIHNKV